MPSELEKKKKSQVEAVKLTWGWEGDAGDKQRSVIQRWVQQLF